MENTQYYLYRTPGGGLKCSYIIKDNPKSYRMNDGTLIPKENFNKIVRKLTEDENKFFDGIIVQKLSNIRWEVGTFIDKIDKLNKALNSSCLATVDTEKFNEILEKVGEELNNFYNDFVYINELKHKINPYYGYFKFEEVSEGE